MRKALHCQVDTDDECFFYIYEFSQTLVIRIRDFMLNKFLKFVMIDRDIPFWIKDAIKI